MKKILLIFILYFFTISGVFSAGEKVEDIFSDIGSDYTYLSELQTLYDKGIIFADGSGKFSPYQLLTREEFVGIMMEVNCTKCIQPSTSYELLQNYQGKNVFFDVSNTSNYFYCIADATQKGFVSGYYPGTVCEDGGNRVDEKPFCPNNTIILEEALAIILRASNILTQNEAEKVREDIRNGIITQPLSSDVTPLNLDGSVYSFYPDFQKALEYELVEYDTNGNQFTRHIIEKTDNKLRPKKSITKEDFIRMAAVVLEANSCLDYHYDNLAIEMKINGSGQKYEFESVVGGYCEKGISTPGGYIWRFYNEKTGEEVYKYGKTISDMNFQDTDIWKIYLRVNDLCGNTSQISNRLIIGGLNVTMEAQPIYGEGILVTQLVGIPLSGKAPFSYFWNFGDTTNGFGETIQHIYKNQGIYKVNLSVTDGNNDMSEVNAILKVGEKGNSFIVGDHDKDGVDDITDACPLVYGTIENIGCPRFIKNESVINTSTSCEYSGGTAIFGNVMCNSCPCNQSLDFNAVLRKCDVIFPAITSEDKARIYSKGGLLQIKE